MCYTGNEEKEMENKQEIVNHILNKDRVYFSNIYSNHKGMLKNIVFKPLALKLILRI